MNKILSPSLLSSNFANLAQEIQKIEALSSPAFVHIDVMDGSFVPQITFGQPVIKSIRKLTKLPFDVHLMIDCPERQIDSFFEAGANLITFHIEACTHSHRLLSYIKDLGMKAGIAICPATPLCMIEELLSLADLVLVMTVNPGFGGQKIIPECVEKVARLKALKQERDGKFLISVDGGVNNQTLQSVLVAGADVVVSGSAFFTGNLQWKSD